MSQNLPAIPTQMYNSMNCKVGFCNHVINVYQFYSSKTKSKIVELGFKYTTNMTCVDCSLSEVSKVEHLLVDI